MSLSSKLAYHMSEAHKADDLGAVNDVYNKWQSCHCYHPVKIRIFDAHLGYERTLEVPCGKCYHCRESHINEWCTRMYAHLEDFKHAYFVTLTYRSFSGDLHPIERLTIEKLAQAVWHFDSINETKRACWSPCLLCKSHYQNFLKRLRFNTGIKDLTYAIAGEYGSQYARPHFHLILFTNSELTHYDIKKAWSVALFRHKSKGWLLKTSQKKDGTSYYFSIGRTDFHDLVKNGSLNTAVKVKVDGRYLNAGNCFAYVCKYVCKQDSYPKKRVQLAFNTFKNNSIYTTNFSNYENKIYYKGLQAFKMYKTLFFGELAEPLFPQDYLDFTLKYSPFVEFSRGTPIGSLYAKAHIQEFASGVFTKPTLQIQSYVLPRYFINKAADYLYGLRKVRQSNKGTSYILANLPDLYRQFSSLSLSDIPERYRVISNSQYTAIESLVKQDIAMYDKYTGEHIVFPLCPDGLRVRFYKFDRHKREYILTRSMPMQTFCEFILQRLSDEQVRYKDKYKQERESVRLIERAFLLAADLGFELTDARDRYEQKQNEYLKHKQREYDEVHTSCE